MDDALIDFVAVAVINYSCGSGHYGRSVWPSGGVDARRIARPEILELFAR